MTTPGSLKAGDKVGIVGTGRKVLVPELQTCQEVLTSWGLTVELAPNLFSNDHSYLAGTDEQRLKGFQTMLDDSEIAAVICARGGYGTTRIIDQLSFESFLKNPKWIVGFSDVTALHFRLLKLGVESIHGIMPILFSTLGSSTSIESLRQILVGNSSPITAEPSKYNKHGKSTGQVLGGNLSLLVDSLSTSSEPDLEGKILIVEEIDEYFYKIDRMFTQLLRAGKLDKLAGLVVGHMTDIKDTSPGFGEAIEEMILNKVSHFNFPVAFDFPIGHENPNLAWRHGSVMTLTVEKHLSLLKPETPS